MSNAFDKLSFLDSFIEEVNSYLPEIETNLERLAQSPGDMDALEETYRRTHTIGGSASMMDFPGLAHVAHGMEDILGDALDGLVTVDQPTLGLLGRSLGRLHQLLEGIRGSVSDEAVIAEDDEDYTRYRALMDATAQGVSSVNPAEVASNGQIAEAMPSPLSQSFDFSAPPSTMPSFDEVLASFRTPSLASGGDVAWPEEEPIPVSRVEQTVPLQKTVPSEPEVVKQPYGEQLTPPSALDALVASTRQNASFYTSPPSDVPKISEPEPSLPLPVAPVADQRVAHTRELTPAIQPPVEIDLRTEEDVFQLPAAYDDMHRETQVLEEQAASLKGLVSQLRSAMSVIEAQRSEFKGFLDGSKDALDRMEDWAGRAMGLNLRNSSEQVRRYLPLSVMWVSNSKLKKVLDLLHQITSGVTVTDEQIEHVLHQLQHSIVSFGEAFTHLQTQAAFTLRQEAGWSSWQMQAEPDANVLRERVTFERVGDSAALRSEIETTLREEIRREYEARSMTQAMRAELEQQIRQEVIQEFEAKRLVQEHVAGAGGDEAYQELERRLRSEIEIQVRQEVLDQLGITGSDVSVALGLPSAATPNRPITSSVNFAERARMAASLGGNVPLAPSPATPASAALSKPVASVSPQLAKAQPKPVAPTTAPLKKESSATAFAGDFGEEAAEIFRLEAEEHLQTISVRVAALEKDPTNRDLIQGIRRATHTLKGAAAMMGFRAIADLSHISEDLLDNIMEGSTAISPAVISIILDTAETLDVLISGKGATHITDESRVQVLRERFTELLGEQAVSHKAPEEELDEDTDIIADVAADNAMVSAVVSSGQSNDPGTQKNTRGDLNVRVRLQRLDELVNLFGEMLVNRSILEERVQRLIRLVSDVGVSSARLREVGQKLESRFEAATLPSGHSVQVMPGEGNQLPLLPVNRNGRNSAESAHLAEFDELELDRYTEFHQLARGLSEGISDMATLSTEMEATIRECEGIFGRENRLSTTFQDRLMKVRLVPISTMTPRLYRAARAVALKQHKEFDFLLEGEETEVDRTVFEEIAGPLLHLMRNAVNHALETPDVRIQKGKSPAGQIKLSAGYDGNQVVITVRDDGIGLDPEHLRNAAISRGVIRSNQVLSEGDLIDLIFRPGFSTAEVLSEESGRGVGLDVVRDSVSRLRGTLEVESTPGQGTAFTMKFPTSLAIQNAMMVHVSGHQFAIPTLVVEAIGRLDNFKRATMGGQLAIVVQGEYYPLYMLAQYLSLPVGQLEDKAQLLIVNAGGNRVALIVEEIKGRIDIMMKSLGPHLRQVHGVAGATVLGNGRVVLILELSDLLDIRPKGVANVASNVIAARKEAVVITPSSTGAVRQSVDLSTKSGAPVRPGTTASSVPERGKHILVVDDSPSVRRVVSSMLKQHGWEVQMARDGIEALEMISAETPAAVLLDIEMPRMGGYELIATVRAQEQYRTLPLVVLTSRAAAKHQQRAMQLGASSYVVKPYQDEELLNTLNSLVFGTAVR